MAVAARRYYTPAEVVVHNTPNDLWVSFLGRVLDLTSLAQEYDGTQEIKPILAHAGKDISHWFDPRTGELKHRIHPVTGVRVPYTPHGPIPHVSLEVPNPLWRPVGVPWWVDSKYVIGFLTEKARPVRILNVLTGQECTLTASIPLVLDWPVDDGEIKVCKEDKLSRISERFLPFNSHASSYTFKFETRVLDMNKTLEENGIPDERELFLDLGLEDNFYIPALMIYFNDDLTEM
uniref:Cytochrome b5 domain-containing protein 1 n=1 Tax=Timema californicum TaxID=61474 RepID=A0A7R9J598_TIMCA|nr:unnamed protein product [Timema californicum]